MSQSTLFVARGRSVSLNGQLHAPGSMVTLPADEAEFLASRGFLQDTPPALTSVASPNPASIGVQDAHVNVQGPRYR